MARTLVIDPAADCTLPAAVGQVVVRDGGRVAHGRNSAAIRFRQCRRSRRAGATAELAVSCRTLMLLSLPLPLLLGDAGAAHVAPHRPAASPP